MNRKEKEQPTSMPLENIYVSPGVRESWSENRSAIVLSIAIVVVMLLVIAAGHTGA
ncbi:MAG: hypothetical protein JO022_03600 [Acidobacteriaceae bacterium]|nr:hypothetical protein [Acidobacteriaceae bacterium]